VDVQRGSAAERDSMEVASDTISEIAMSDLDPVSITRHVDVLRSVFALVFAVVIWHLSPWLHAMVALELGAEARLCELVSPASYNATMLRILF